MKHRIVLTIAFVLGIFLLAGCNFRVTLPEVDELKPTAIVFEDSSNRRIYVGETVDLQATTSPPTADQSILWSSSNDGVASVTEEGVVTGVAPGVVNIIARSGYFPELTKSILVIVEHKPTSILISGKTSLLIDEVIVLSIVSSPEDADNRVTWESSNSTIVSVNASGIVTAKQLGTVQITATSIADDSVIAIHEIVVEPRVLPPTALQITGKTTHRVGEIAAYSIVITPLEAIRTVVWSSSDEAVGMIAENGVFTAVGVGTVTLTATSTENDVYDTITLTIEEKLEPTILNLEDLLIHVIEFTSKSVVGVSNYAYDEETNRLERVGIGSGSVYKVWAELNDGTIVSDPNLIPLQTNVKKYVHYIMTNRHVIEDSMEVRVYLPEDDEEYPATLIQFDDKVDLAVVYFEHNRYIPALVIGDSEAVRTGSFALAIGNPSGYRYANSATFGMISHPKRYMSEDTDGDGINDWDGQYIQHQVPINPGNSGGPLLNLKGEIIGMNTWKFASTTIEGMGFSIPSNVIADLLPILERGEQPVRARIGITVIEVRALISNPDPEKVIPEGITYGMYITGVLEGGVASIAGVQANDILLTFNGISVRTSVELRGELGKIVVGSGIEIEIEVYRNGELITLVLVF